MVLNSPGAVQMSIFVVRAFTAMREQLAVRDVLDRRLTEAERKLLRHDSALQDLYVKLKSLSESPPATPRRQIGFNPKQ
jgi:AraC-like DNA-binding protein